MLKIGTSGFSFKDWTGTVYPKNLRPQNALNYYYEELGFDCVEINSTYYTLVSERSFEGMERKTGSDFEFVVKAYRGMTHDPFDNRIKENKPSYSKAIEDTRKFIYSILPLKEKNKLGAVLLQFPVFFLPNSKALEYILELKEEFKNIPLAIEFRNKAWAKEDTFSFLKKNGLAYCIVDEPDLPRLMPFIPEITSDIAYLRLHGRNKNWFNAPLSQRYDYLYSDKELKKFVPEMKNLKKKSKKAYIFFNNCHEGSAIKNALTIKGLLDIKIKKDTLF